MGYVIEISEHKLDKATDYAEKMLKYGGMLMQCLTEWDEEGGYGERSGSQGGYSRSMMGSRGDYGSRGGYNQRGDMGYREDGEWDDEEMMHERRGRRRRDSMGRYR
jgi:hypothetical protein